MFPKQINAWLQRSSKPVEHDESESPELRVLVLAAV